MKVTTQYILYILFIGVLLNLSPIIDAFLHPNIPYFDTEHIIVGGVSGLIGIIFVLLWIRYLKRERQSKAKINDLIYNMNDGFMVDNIYGDVIFCNTKFLEIFDLCQNDIDNGVNLVDYVEKGYINIHEERHKKRISGEPVEDVFEYRGIKKSGERLWIKVRVSVIKENGKITGTQSIISDVTKAKENEIMLEKANGLIIEIEESERTKLAYDLHDNFGQILAATKMHLNSIESTAETKTIDDLIESALSSIRGIINQLHPKDLDNIGLEKTIENLCQQVSHSKSLKILLKCEESFKENLLSNHQRFYIYRIVQECLGNSIKHSKCSEIEIILSIENGEIIILFTNNGEKINEGVATESSNFSSLKRRTHILKGKFKLKNNRDNNVGFEFRFPLVID